MEPVKTEPRLLTEDEHAAIVADRVSRETSSLTEQVSSLGTEKAELQTKLDTSEAALETEKAAHQATQDAFEAFKTKVESDKEIASRRTDREAKVREVAAHLKDDFFTDERVQRWAEMSEEAFASFVAETAALVGGKAPSGDQPPRETAMQGRTPTVTAEKGNLGKLWGGRTSTQKEG